MARSSTAVFQSPADGIEFIVRARTLKMSGSIGVAAVEVFFQKPEVRHLLH